jgi:hypothetical protein
MRYLSQSDHEDIRELRAIGWSTLAIAARFEVCQATVSNVLNGRSKPKRRNFVPKPPKPPQERPVITLYEDFSQLPDHVLFQPVKECNFIG